MIIQSNGNQPCSGSSSTSSRESAGTKIAPLFRLSILVMLIAAFLNLTSCLNNLPWNQEKDFENDMVKALNLKFISRDNDYEYSPLRVFNDTLVGKYSHFDNHQMEYHYFIQSLKNPNYKVVFNNEDLDVPLISPIDYYRNGCIYFGKYQGVFMQKICIDGSLTNYFNNSTDTDQIKPSYESKVMIYKNQAVLSLINGLFVFDIPSQKLIWKWHRGDNAQFWREYAAQAKAWRTRALAN